MTRYAALHQNPDKDFHQSKSDVSTCLLLVNLGTPDAPTPSALRRYLAEFLADPRVVEIPRIIWLCILHGIILRIRPKKSAAKYQSIWTDEGSPLLVISQKQRDAIQAELGDAVKVKLAMRYGNPSISSVLAECQAEGLRKLVVLPLYPQYAAPTTASVFDAVARVLTSWRWVPELHFINQYSDHPLYIEALANSIREFIEANGKPEKLVISYHGMPKRFLLAGDPYYCFCQKTSRLLQEKMGLDKDFFITSFQSRFGKAEWLKPYTDETLLQLVEQGVKRVAVVSPAFSVDCLETLEELAMENREVFLKAGGETYDYIPALNDRPDHIAALAAVAKAHL